jgi:hypothetical protein
VLPATSVSQLVRLPRLRGLVALHGGALSQLPIASLLALNRRSSLLMEAVIPLSSPNDGSVGAVCSGIIGDHSAGTFKLLLLPFFSLDVRAYNFVVAFISRHRVRKKFHVLLYDPMSSSLRPFGEVRWLNASPCHSTNGRTPRRFSQLRYLTRFLASQLSLA